MDFASVVCSLFFYAIGAFFDLKSREVPDKVWLAYGPVALILLISRLLMGPSTLMLILVSIGFTTLTSFALFFFGMFGGADAKAMICLSLALPVAPRNIQPLMGYVHPFFPVTVLIVSYFCSASMTIWLGLKNLTAYFHEGSTIFEGLEDEPWWKKALASVTGYRESLANLTKTFYLYPMEKVVQDADGPVRRFHLLFNAEVDRDRVVSEFLRSLKDVGSPSEVWVSPGIPMLLFMLIGLIITLIIGDPIFSTVFSLASHG